MKIDRGFWVFIAIVLSGILIVIVVTIPQYLQDNPYVIIKHEKVPVLQTVGVPVTQTIVVTEILTVSMLVTVTHYVTDTVVVEKLVTPKQKELSLVDIALGLTVLVLSVIGACVCVLLIFDLLFKKRL